MTSRFFQIAVTLTIVSAILLACNKISSENPSSDSNQIKIDALSCNAQLHGDRLVPASGVWFGVNLDFSRDNPTSYSQRLGLRPALYTLFLPIPIDESNGGYLDKTVESLKHSGGMLLLTLEPRNGLDSVTQEVADSVAARLSGYNARGVMVLLRFAHEMNGSWYEWSQQPAKYIFTYRRVADAVHRLATGTAMLWAPNYGGGYPFHGGKFEARQGSSDRRALDTDGDGKLTGTDDPYAPYYPGDAWVDWVGMSIYHWGSSYPWGDNKYPEPEKFTRMLEGKYNGSAGDERSLPDFYKVYGVDHNKPVGVFETAAFYAPSKGGADEMKLKSDWWKQVYAEEIPVRFPRLRMINWFEWDKYETEVKDRVDWTVTFNPKIRTAFRGALPNWLQFAEDVDYCTGSVHN